MSNLTPRQERFCQKFVYYLNAAKAARNAGYAPRTANREGYRLLQDPRVARRIQEIQWALAEQHGRDTDTLVGKLEMVYRRAMEDGRYHAAARAVALQAELTTGGSMPHRLWRDLADAAAKTLKVADQEQAATKAAPGDAAAETAPPYTGQTFPKAVGA